jgi:cytolysin (calcineurin-like family phosphatase)
VEAAPQMTPEPSMFIVIGIAMLVAIVGIRRRPRAALTGMAMLLFAGFQAQAQSSQAYNIIRNSEAFGSSTCHPDSDTTKTAGCCGAPGIHGCVSVGSVCTAPSGNKLRIDPYSSGNIFCNLPAPSCSGAVASAIANGGDTFYATSDIHFFRPEFAVKDQINHVAEINGFATGNYRWGSFFGLNSGTDSDTIAAPRAVIVNGDATLDSSIGNLGAFRLLYEQGNLAESLQYPMFFGLGNHDSKTQVPDSSAAKRMFDYLTSRMNCGGTNMDAGSNGSGNYSWDFGGTHFVQLNVWAGNTADKYRDSPTGLEWLQNDLIQNVGNSGRPVVINQHFPFSMVGGSVSDDVDWSTDDFNSFWSVIQDFNVIGMFAGHTHQEAVDRASQNGLTTKDSAGNSKVFEEFVSGTGGADNHGSFIVARITPNYLDVGTVQWNSATTSSPYPPYPLALYFDGNQQAAQGISCRKRINSRFVTLSSNLAGVTLQQNPGDPTKFTATVSHSVGSGSIPGPVAVAVSALASLANRSFVDYCTAGSNSHAYILLTDAQLASLNQGTAVSLPLTFVGSGAGATASLVQLTPLKSANPGAVSMVSGVGGGNSPAPTDPGLQTVVFSGNPGTNLNASFDYPNGGPSNWLTSLNAPARYDQFGFATITFRVNTQTVQGLSPSAQDTLQATLYVTGALPTDLYSLPIALHFKVAASVSFSIDPPITVNTANVRPIFTTQVTYANKAQLIDGSVNPVGTMTLYVATHGSNPEVFTPLSYFYVNSTNDFPDCNLPPTDTVYFNYAANNQKNYCQSFQGAPTASTSPFNWAPFVDIYDVYASYSGDANYAPAVSPVITYRVGSDPAVIGPLTGAQTSPIGGAFGTALKAFVHDSTGRALNGVSVVFTAPGSGASGTFAGAGNTVTVTTGADGTASTPILTANTIPGGYSVTATVFGTAISTTFALINTPLANTPQLTAAIVSRTGILSQREWTVGVTSHGGTASSVAITGIALQQTGGPPCSAPPTVLDSFPQSVNAGLQQTFLFNFGTCAATSRFTVVISVAASGGYTSSTTMGNQFP